MSFFNDIFNELSIHDECVDIRIILNKCLYLCGKFNVIEFNDCLILISINDVRYEIVGCDLKIKSLAKNELLVYGDIDGFIKDWVMADKLKIKIYGFNLKQIIAYLIERGVFVFDLKIKSKYVLFNIYSKDKNILDKYCKIHNRKYEVIDDFSLKKKLKKLKLSFGCLFACLLTICYVVSFNYIIFDVNIYNDSNVDYDLSKVKGVLNENKIINGSIFVKQNRLEIENLILTKLDDIVGCSVDIVGGKLSVGIIPEIKKKENKNKQLFSKYDAVITEINIYSGESEYVVGSVVKADDLIVSSATQVEANVRGNVYFSSSLIYNKYKQNIKYTGRFLVNKKLFIFNKLLFKRQNNIYFSKYLTKKCDFYIMENYLFPIKCESEYCFEYEVFEEIVEFEKVENELKNKLYDEVCSKIPSDGKILNTYYSVVKEGDLTRLDCFVEANLSLI